MTTLTYVIASVALALTLGIGLALFLAAGRQRRRRRALQMQERFLSALCHELRTPLNAIAGTVPLLQHGSASARDRALAVLSRNVRIESALIDELLGASEVLVGSSAPRPAPLHLGRLLEAAANRLQISAQERGVRLRVVRSSPEPPVSADRRHLAAAVTYLLSHAIRHAKTGATVLIDYRRMRGAVAIRFVTEPDRARGLWHSMLTPISGRLPDAITDDQALGLSVVREQLAQQGGELSIEPAGGEAVAWTVTLPCGLPSPRIRAHPVVARTVQ